MMMRKFMSGPVKEVLVQSRKMAAHAKVEAPAVGGLEGFVAKYLPKNHHVCNVA